MLALIASNPVNGPTLIVVPSHLVSHWISEINTHFQPGVFEYDSYFGTKRHTLATNPSANIIFTSYGTVRSDFVEKVEDITKKHIPQHAQPLMFPSFRLDSIFNHRFGRIIFDESHNFRNQTCTARAVLNLYAPHVWCLTATPIMNRINDLFMQVAVLGISPYDNTNDWKSRVIRPMGLRPITTFDSLMRHVIVPFSMRRLKSHLSDMPERNEEIIWLDFSDEEDQLYELMLDYTRAQVDRIMTNIDILRKQFRKTHKFVSRMKMSIGIFILRLRQCCCHPELVIRRVLDMEDNAVDLTNLSNSMNLLHEKIAKGLQEECSICLTSRATHSSSACSHCICPKCVESLKKYNIQTCPICRVLVPRWGEAQDMLKEMEVEYTNGMQITNRECMDPLASCKVRWVAANLQQHNDKVIIVSQWIDHLEIYSKLLDRMNLKYVWLDGSIAAHKRHHTVAKFQNTPDIRVCLLSLTASSEGINLTSACRVYHVDPWWNESKAVQASDRVHRIGQTKDVYITHLRVRDSVEAAIQEMQERKTKVSNVVVGLQEATAEMKWANDIRLLLAPREAEAHAKLKKSLRQNRQ